MEAPKIKRPDIPKELTEQQRKELERLLDKYKEVFSEQTGKLGRTSLIEHEIHTQGAPIRQP